MLNLKLTFSAIDYEKTLSALFPRILSKIHQINSNSFPIRLIQKVGQSSERAALEILSRLPDASKRDIVLTAFRIERTRIVKSLLDVLHGNEYGRHINFSDAFMACSKNGQIECYLQDIDIDYHALSLRMLPIRQAEDLQHTNNSLPVLNFFRPLARRTANYAAQAAGTLMNMGAGDMTLSFFLKNSGNTLMLTKVLEKTLKQNGIHVEVSACELLDSKEGIPPEVVQVHQDESIPSELIESLLDILAAYIIELIEKNG